MEEVQISAMDLSQRIEPELKTPAVKKQTCPLGPGKRKYSGTLTEDNRSILLLFSY